MTHRSEHLLRRRTPIRVLMTTLLMTLLATALPLQAAEVQVAVAANFAAPLQAIAQRFAQQTGHRVNASVGSTGKLAAHIRNGAPYEVLLAADAQTPQQLVQTGLGVANTATPYAYGQLVLWSRLPGQVDGTDQVLRRGAFRKLALADPKLAPYGAAAQQALNALGLLEALRPRWVLGTSVGQAHQFVASGNAELGFVALSQVWAKGQFTSGSGWIVPAALHDPIEQHAVLLQKGVNNPAAMALLQFLHQPDTQALIRSFGYNTQP